MADSAAATESTAAESEITATTAPVDTISTTIGGTSRSSSPGAVQDPTSTNVTPLSKSQQKKAAKAARFAEYKIERRAREKEAKKRKKQERAQKRAAGELHSDDDGEGGEQGRKKKKMKRGQPFGATVVVDLGFDDKMTDKEVNSLTSQLAYTYSANRSAASPFHNLLFTSLNGRTFERLETMNDASYRRWTRVEWWITGYEGLWDESSSPNVLETKSERPPQKAQKDKVVYLTADCDEELEELKEDETYIIGGVVDRNRYKNLCRDKAVEGGVRIARLPIGKYMADMPTRKVLTVNQVFEILLRWLETRDWKEALYTVMPKRKFIAGKGKKIEGDKNELAADEEGVEDAIQEGDQDQDAAEHENEDIAEAKKPSKTDGTQQNMDMQDEHTSTVESVA